MTCQRDMCWPWHGYIDQNGYGQLTTHRADGSRSLVPAHRFVYALAHDLSEGDVVHHKCDLKSCVNPEHLQALSRSGHARLHADRPDSCPQGHPYNDINTYTHPRRGYLVCRACHRERERRRYRAKERV